jgi:hypothetical protein
MVTSEAEVLEASAALVARTETDAGAGRLAGAVYTPFASIIPSVAFPPGIPFTLQVTAVFTVPLTVTVNVCGSPSGTDAVAGAIATVMVEEGGCGGPTSPLQPRNDATKSNAGRQGDGMSVKKQRPRSFVLVSIEAGNARGVPARCTEKNPPFAKIVAWI